jgi:hypothetical protein
VASLIVAPVNSLASSVGSGSVTVELSIISGGPTGQGVDLIAVSPAPPGQPGCASPNPGGYAIDLSTAGGRAAAALVLSAVTQNEKITVVGNGTCGLWGDRETAVWVSKSP